MGMSSPSLPKRTILARISMTLIRAIASRIAGSASMASPSARTSSAWCWGTSPRCCTSKPFAGPRPSGRASRWCSIQARGARHRLQPSCKVKRRRTRNIVTTSYMTRRRDDATTRRFHGDRGDLYVMDPAACGHTWTKDRASAVREHFRHAEGPVGGNRFTPSVAEQQEMYAKRCAKGTLHTEPQDTQKRGPEVLGESAVAPRKRPASQTKASLKGAARK
jgi:hypothetical protein